MKQIITTIKKMSLFSLTLTVLGLSGCTGMMHQLGFEPIQNTDPSTVQCADATVLITNLTARVPDQQYQTLNGETCTGLNDENRT